MRAGSVTDTLNLALLVGLAAALVYLFRRVQPVIEAGEQAYQSARTGAANLIETFFPLVDPDSMMTYAVTFPDGSRHAVPGESVGRGGYFNYKGVRYRLMTSTNGQKIAVAA